MTLTTLARCVEMVPNFQSADNAVMQNCLDAASSIIETFCNRTFALTAYDEVLDGRGGYDIRLANDPITQIDQVMWGWNNVVQIRNTDQGVSRASFRISPDTATPAAPATLTLVSSKNGTTTTRTVDMTATATLASLATAISAFSADGWSSEALGVYGTWATADLWAQQGAKECRWYGNAYIMHHVWNMQEFNFNPAPGEVVSTMGFAKGYRNYRVKYTAGFSTIPAPIQQACAALAVHCYHSRGVNSNLSAESLGGYSYSNIAEKSFRQLDLVSRYGLMEYKRHSIAKFRVF